MDRLAKFIVKHRIFFMVFFLALLIICACLIPQVKINYNLTNYMPKESEFANASDILADEEWDNEVITAMLKGVEKSDQQKVVDKLSKIDNIDSVQISKYSAEQKAVLLNITLKADLSNTQLKTCIGQLRDNGTGYETFLSGMSINDMFIQDTTDSETGKIMLFLIPIVLLVLIFTSKSWLEPIICLGIMGVAIAISMGTNIIFTGGVSFITQSILAALTMAISMDYSIFMLHAFRDECNNGVEPTLAVVSAVKKSFTSITVGSLTTIAGFVAMLFMKFALGIDMGWVFAKTILISLLTVLFLMPGVLLLLHKAIVKTEHKNLFPSFKGVGRVAVKGRYVFAIMAVIILIPAVYGQFNNNFIYGFSSMTEAEGSSLYKDNKAITDIFDTGNQMVILYKNDGDLDKESKLLSDLMKYKSNDKTVVKDTSLSYSSVLKQFGLYDGANAFLKGMGKPTLTLTEFDKAIADPESELMKSLALVAGAKQQLLTGANAFLQGAGLQPLTMEQFNLAIADPNSELMVMLNQVVGAKQQMLDGVNAFLGGAGQQPLTMEQFNEAISHPDTGLMLQLKQVLGAKEQLLLGANAFLKQSGKAELTEEQFDTARLDPTSELMTLLKGTIDQATTARQQLFAGANGFLTQMGKPTLTIEQFDTARLDPTSELMTLLKGTIDQATTARQQLFAGSNGFLTQMGKPALTIEQFDNARLDPTSELMTLLKGTIDQATTARQQLFAGANGFLTQIGKPALTIEQFDTAIVDPTSELMTLLAQYAQADPSIKGLYDGIKSLPPKAQIESLTILYNGILSLPTNEAVAGLQNLYNGLGVLPAQSQIDSLNTLYSSIKLLPPNEQLVGLQNLYNGILSLPTDKEIDGLKALLDGINSLTPDVDDVKLLYFGVQSLASALKEVRPMFIGKQHSRIILQLDLAEEGDATFLALDELKVIANAEYKDNNYFYGLSQVAYDIKEVVEVDYIVVTVISIIAIFLMIMIPFKSLSIPVILLFVIELGIFINMAIPFFAGITLSYISYLIISAIELGCTIDYAILMVGKYIDYRKSLPPKESAIESVNSSAASILTSGGILTIVGLLINLISSNQLISETGGMLWRAGVLSMLFVFFLLPGLFVIFDRFVIRVKKSKHKKALQTPDVSSDEYIIPFQTSIDKSKEEVEPQSQNITNKRKK